jgi:hypothetical protein
MSVPLELKNPSPFHPLRIFSQDRLRTHVVDAPTAAPLPKRHTREALQKIGSEIVNVPSRGTARGADGMLTAVTRDVPTPFFKTAGFESLSEFITETSEKELRAQQAAASAAAMMASAGTARTQRVLDEWNCALKQFMSIPPGGKTILPLEENSRVLVETDDPAGVTLQVQNQSLTRTLRLRNRDSKKGDVSHVAFLAPAQVSIVTAGNSVGAIVELLST